MKNNITKMVPTSQATDKQEEVVRKVTEAEMARITAVQLAKTIQDVVSAKDKIMAFFLDRATLGIVPVFVVADSQWKARIFIINYEDKDKSVMDVAKLIYLEDELVDGTLNKRQADAVNIVLSGIENISNLIVHMISVRCPNVVSILSSLGPLNDVSEEVVAKASAAAMMEEILACIPDINDIIKDTIKNYLI